MAPSVLLIRINAYGELFNTRHAVENIRTRFPGAEITALVTPQSEGKALLEADPRLDRVQVFPPDAGSVKSPTAFRAFARRHPAGVAVACVGATVKMDYCRPLLSLLLCPGRKYVLDARGDIYAVAGPRGLAAVFRALLASVRVRAVNRVGAGLVRAAKTFSRRVVRPSNHGKAEDAAGVGLDLTREQVKRILWIRVDGVGDVVMTLPALNALRSRFPEARIDLLVRPMSAPLVRALPGIDRVYTFEPGDAPHSTRSPGKRRNVVSLAMRLRGNRYDLAADPAGRDVARALAFASGARRRISPQVSIYDDPAHPNLSFLMTDALPLNIDKVRPAADSFLCLLQKAGVPRPEGRYRLPVSGEHQEVVAEKRRELGSTCPYAVIHARSAEDAKDWRPERFAAVARHLREAHGLDVVLTGTTRDREYNAQIIADSDGAGHLLNAAGVFDLAELPALYRQASIMVTVDTGPMHIAAMVGTPLVALFLPWFVHRDGPYGQADSVLVPFSSLTVPPEHAADFWEGRLLDGISVEDVIRAIDAKMMPSEIPLPRAA